MTDNTTTLTTEVETSSAENNSVPSQEETSNKKKRSITPLYPKSDSELRIVVKTFSENFIARNLILIWLPAVNIRKTVSNYDTFLNEKTDISAKSKPGVVGISEIMKEMDEKIEPTKGYFTEKYGKKLGPSYYAQISVVKDYKGYKLPIKQDARLAGLDILIKGLQENGFADRMYGVAYWTDVRDRFKALLNSSLTSSTKLSGKQQAKNTHKLQVIKMMDSMINVVKGNYPDNWKSTLREMGLLKERY